MKKFIIGLILVLVVVIWQLTAIYKDVNQRNASIAQKAITEAKKQFNIRHVLSAEEYRGEKSFEVIEAELDNGTKLWIWMPEKGKMAIPVTARVSDGYTKQEIEQAFQKNVSYRRLVSVKLGMENTMPVWEITYIDPNGDYVFSYYDFYSGKSVINPIALN
jgi:uncharacterized protein YpmB